MSAKPKDTDGGGESEAAGPPYEPVEPGGASPSSGPEEAPRDPRRRFSDRVDNYVKYRPTYPRAVFDFLRQRGALSAESVVADVGSGTGISCRLFLDNGNTVYGVEPNADMRRAAERLLAGHPRFHSIDGSAEATTLLDGSVDLVVAAQAFHWFDPAAARTEFRRILRPGGRVALMWNTRKTAGSPALEAYERLLNEYATDYRAVRHDRADGKRFEALFGGPEGDPGGYERAVFPNEQRLDCAGFEGRLLSSSYAPAPGHPRHAPMLAALREVFDRFNTGGQVTIEYETEVYLGRPAV